MENDFANTKVTIRLDAHDLLSKFGFRDGDLLFDVVMDMRLRKSNEPLAELLGSEEELVRIVKTTLVEEIGKHHDVELTYCETAHNPVRLVKLDGKAIDFAASMDGICPKSVEVELQPSETGWIILGYKAVGDDE